MSDVEEWETSPYTETTSLQYALLVIWIGNMCADAYYTMTPPPVAKDEESGPAAPKKTAVPSFLEGHRVAARDATYFGFIMLLFYLCDGAQVLNIQQKSYDRDFFIFLMVIVLIFSCGTKADSKRPAILSREQTEEWKGWMQLAFLLYHYFAAKELYNYIRMLIAAYVWMTGYGNFSYFYKYNDFSPWRVSKMLFRLNFLVLMILMVMNTDYMLYYICPMHTLWFLSVYAMMGIYPSLNKTTGGIWTKFAVYALIVGVIWDVPGVCEKFWSPLSWLLAIPGAEDPMHEWVFRTGLDHWSTFAGMVCAWGYPHVVKWFESKEAENGAIAVKTIFLVPAMYGMYWWTNNVFLQDKYAYNAVHTYYSWFPIVTYIFVRNMIPSTRNWHLEMLCSCGKITLETYLCQYHIWMARHGDLHVAAVLTIIPGYPLVNFLLNSVIYVYLAQKLFDQTTILSNFMLPKPSQDGDWKIIGMRWATVIGAQLAVFIVVAVGRSAMSSE